MSQSRQLAAIMFTDIVGYTALMGEDEQKAFELLKKNRSVQRPIIEKFNGRWLKEIGDGVLASFPTVTDAVYCAKEIQETCQNEPDLKLRIGIHEGEVVFEGDDVFGDGVNIASRLEPLAPIGGILVSESVFINISNKKGIEIGFLREETLKNVKHPVKIYQIEVDGVKAPVHWEEVIEEGDMSEFSPTKETKRSIAVLPFVNMSNDPEQEYFCDGMTEEIINALSHVENLKVIARTSAFMFKGKNEDIREIGKKLDVETLLEGSVRKAGDKIRITAQLIEVADGSHLWSERFDRDLEDIFAIQDEISLAIVDNLKVKLLVKEKDAIVKRYTENLEAKMLYLKGRQLRQRKNSEDFNRALNHLEKSIALDPKFALAYAEIAFTYILMGWFCAIEVNDKLREKIISNAEEALSLDKHVSEAYIALALTWELFDHDQVKAEKFARQAVRLNPGNNEAVQEHAFILGRMGRFKPAIKRMEFSITLDPLSILANNGLGYTLFYQGHFKSAIKQMQNIIEVDSTFFPARLIISLSLTEIKDYTNALQELNKCPQSNPLIVAHRGYLYAKMKRTQEAFSTLEEIKREFSKNSLFEFLIALIYAGMDDKDNAFKWLQKSQDKYGFIYRDKTIGADFRINHLKKDPRFSKLNY